MRGPKKIATDGAHGHTDGRTDGHGDYMAELAQWGRCSEKSCLLLVIFKKWPPLPTYFRHPLANFCLNQFRKYTNLKTK